MAQLLVDRPKGIIRKAKSVNSTVIAARDHRNRENERRKHNNQHRQAQAFVIACGLNPSFTPSHPDGTREVRREQIRPQLRAKRFVRNLSRFFG